MNSINEIKNNSILYTSFNQDNSFFSVGTENGFRIYQTYPFTDHYEKIMNGGIGVVEMQYNSNFLALMGGGQVPKYSKNKLIIWDDQENKVISELKFSASILNVKLKKDRLFVVCKKRIYVFDFNTYEIVDKIDTGDNKKDLIAINGAPEFTILAFPSLKEESKISIKNCEKKTIINFSPQADSVSKIGINYNGTLIATSNESGTIIRIHSCIDGALLQEFKRGLEKAKINYICFDNDSRFMALSSNRGTIHIFSLGSTIKKLKEHEKEKKNEKKKEKPKNESKGNDKIKKEENLKEKINKNEKEDKKEEKLKEKKEKEKNIEIDEDIEKKEEENKNNKNEKNINNNNNINNNINNNNNEENKINEIIKEEELPVNNKSFFRGLEKSFAKVKIKSQDSICAFANNNMLIIVSSDNKYYQAEIDLKKGGDCKIIFENKLIEKPFDFEII